MNNFHACLNPACPQPSNPIGKSFCAACGQSLISLKGHYRPIKFLGSGGFGRTFIAVDTDCQDDLCVIKQLAPQGFLHPQQLQTVTKLFEEEARLLEKLGEDYSQLCGVSSLWGRFAKRPYGRSQNGISMMIS